MKGDVRCAIRGLNAPCFLSLFCRFKWTAAVVSLRSSLFLCFVECLARKVKILFWGSFSLSSLLTIIVSRFSVVCVLNPSLNLNAFRSQKRHIPLNLEGDYGLCPVSATVLVGESWLTHRRHERREARKPQSCLAINHSCIIDAYTINVYHSGLGLKMDYG